MFRDHHSLPGTLRKVRSAGSQSREFMDHNFTEEYHDTVYVTSNPFITTLDDGVFHAVIDLFDEAWDENDLTVRPESVVRRQHSMPTNVYPEKRIIAHFMQPHYPVYRRLGQTDRKWWYNRSNDAVGGKNGGDTHHRSGHSSMLVLVLLIRTLCGKRTLRISK